MNGRKDRWTPDESELDELVAASRGIGPDDYDRLLEELRSMLDKDGQRLLILLDDCVGTRLVKEEKTVKAALSGEADEIRQISDGLNRMATEAYVLAGRISR